MRQGEIKSCFVTTKDLTGLGTTNQCKFCAKSLVDIRGLNTVQTLKKLDRIKEPCVISGENQLVDKRNFGVKIKDSLVRAKKLYSGPRLVYYSVFFVLMTTVTSCMKKRNVIGKIAPSKQQKENPTSIGFYHMDNSLKESK